MESGILSKEELDKVSVLNMYSMSDYGDIRKRESDLKEIFISWFRKELKEATKIRENIMIMISLKRIEEELRGNLSFKEVLEKYDTFKNILDYRGGTH